jgi:hypothetical protein
MKSAAYAFMLMFLGSLSGMTQEVKTKQAPEPAPDYFPLTVGNTWHYQVDAGNGRKFMILKKIAEVETIDGMPMARLETIANGMVVATEHLRRDGRGIFRHRFNGVEVSPPFCVLRYPPKGDRSWESRTKVGDQELTMRGHEGRTEEVTVPAGKYQAVTSVIKTTTNDVEFTTTYWFTADVGVVRESLDRAGQNVNLTLLKFEPHK